MEHYDAIIIGIGQAGNPLSRTLVEQGYRIAVIEREHPGGSCINYGELMGMLQIAMIGKLTYQQLRDGLFAHPTYAEVFNNLFAHLENPH